MAKDEKILRKYNIAPSAAKGLFARYAKQARSAMLQQESLPTGDIMTADSVAYADHLIGQKSDLANIENSARQRQNKARSDLQGIESEMSSDRNTIQKRMDQLDRDIKNMDMGIWGQIATGVSLATGINSMARSFTNWRDRKAADQGDEKPSGWIYKGMNVIGGATEVLPVLKARREKEVAQLEMEKRVSDSLMTREEADKVLKESSEYIDSMIKMHGDHSVASVAGYEKLHGILLGFNSSLLHLEQR